MARKVTYRGSGKNTLRPQSYEHREGGETYPFTQGESLEVPDDVAAALAQLPGQQFDIDPLEGGVTDDT